jgi:hypothetical protein
MKADRSAGSIEDYSVPTGTDSIDQDIYPSDRALRGAPVRHLKESVTIVTRSRSWSTIIVSPTYSRDDSFTILT